MLDLFANAHYFNFIMVIIILFLKFHITEGKLKLEISK